MDNKVDRKIYLNQLINSGKITHNGNDINFLQGIVSRFGTENYSAIRIIQSEKICTFSEKNTIYISTGLIAQATDIETIAFFIAREIAMAKSTLVKELDTKKVQTSFDGKIVSFSDYGQNLDLQLDKLGYELYVKAGFNNSGAARALKLIQYASFPFLEIEVPADYFNTANYYIPPTFFQQANPQTTIPQSQKKINDEIGARLKALNLNDLKVGTAETLSEEFNELVKNARFETCYQKLISGHINSAIYDIFLLEETYTPSDELEYWKAYAWYRKSIQKLKLSGGNKYLNVGIASSSANFYYFLRRLPTDGVLSIALSKLHNQKANSPRLEELWGNLLIEIKRFPYTHITDFKTKNYLETFRNSASDEGMEKIDYLDSLQSNVALDSAHFYHYGISNIVSDSLFWLEYNSAEDNVVPAGSKIAIYTGLFSTKKRAKNKSKSDKVLEKLVTDFTDCDSLKVLKGLNSISLKSQRAIKEAFAIQYANSDYDYAYPIIDTSFLSELESEGDYVGIALFQHAFRPKLRAYHMLGLFGIPLPFVVGDFLMTMNQWEYCIVIIDKSNGEIVHSENAWMNNSLNKFTLYDRIRSSVYKAQH